MKNEEKGKGKEKEIGKKGQTLQKITSCSDIIHNFPAYFEDLVENEGSQGYFSDEGFSCSFHGSDGISSVTIDTEQRPDIEQMDKQTYARR